ncbi:MAG: hypothetical protein E7466_00640 [Ruminococcaceae bacterium]|nr:hypothetical protein [Oscillospiraceae bacterium]MBQ3215839.1 nucleotidyltransferase family protein [Oscillospiraceae bacterium]
MEEKYELFLQAVGAALRNESLSHELQPSGELMLNMLDLAQDHHVLPMVFEAVHDHPSLQAVDPAITENIRRLTIHAVMGQAVKTVDFLRLSQHLRKNGVRALVVKGIVCRNLYPKPDHRCSGDEDVLCGEEGFRACHKAMLSFGMEPGGDLSLESYEVPYMKNDSPLYIELHKTLFARNSDVFNDYNRFFEDVFHRSVDVEIRGMKVATMCPTDHMFYLIIHAFKHFLHSGFGIRQVCDIALFANAYGSQIDWQYVYDRCCSIRAEKFAAALLTIGQKYLVFSPDTACLPQLWRDIKVDETPLLMDLMSSGIYGTSDINRIHSSNMTINAVADEKRGKKSKKSVLRTVFPSAKSLEKRYRYLRRHKYLLPVAWTSRILGFAKESLSNSDTVATEVLRTGSQRIELLKQYDIIDR